jgi:ubiquinone/menaquinone biosynthesis C-methylase UbiE
MSVSTLQEKLTTCLSLIACSLPDEVAIEVVPSSVPKESDMTRAMGGNTAPSTKGKLIHWALAYDISVWMISLGTERAFRDRLVELARLAPGESVLDVGCGTGTLAIAAKRRVGSTGKVNGIDPSPEMIARARKKTLKAGVEVVFETAVAESLPFPEATFDAVLSTAMLHHLADDEARRQCIHEIRRVLRPGGRLLAVDFGVADEKRGLVARLFHNPLHFDICEVIPMLSEVGLITLESGSVGVRSLRFILAAAPSAA